MSILIVAGILSFMIFFPIVVATSVFRVLDEKQSSNFLRIFFPKYYLFGLVLGILGLIISNVVGKRIYAFIENILNKIPIVNKIYNTTKQITNTFTKPNNQAFQKVVLLEYPKADLWTLAMVTGTCKNLNEIECYKLFVPTTPNPTSGYLIIIDKTKVKETNISVEEGLSIIISGGMVSPDKFEF